MKIVQLDTVRNGRSLHPYDRESRKLFSVSINRQIFCMS